MAAVPGDSPVSSQARPSFITAVLHTIHALVRLPSAHVWNCANENIVVGCENSLDKCNDPFAQCMKDTCAETGFLGWLSRWVRPKCEGERKIYEAVVRGKKGKEHYKKDTEKFCDCVDSPPITIKRPGKTPILAYSAGVDDGKTYEGPNPTIPVVGIIDGETITFQPTFRPTGA